MIGYLRKKTMGGKEYLIISPDLRRRNTDLMEEDRTPSRVWIQAQGGLCREKNLF